ncbi:response regulator transcription factor [Parapedobacter tibetensis]|uniref:response regulator transcription factor n=1 Tax=Parapedobacter tibetensis TaxID=2972951 RepID=UPI00214D3630|nr:response regulator transcription factor [Parapedobacter tibetensis]
MKFLLKKYFPFSVISEAQNFQKTIRDLPKKEYDLIVLDAEIGNGANVLGTVEQIKSICPKTRILIFSELDEAIYAPKYTAFGTNGYLTKTADIDSILSAIGIALDGGVFHGEIQLTDSTHATTMQNPFKQLSKREAKIADLLIKGIPLTAIAKVVSLKETTISTYKRRIFKKINVNTLSDLIKLRKLFQ